MNIEYTADNGIIKKIAEDKLSECPECGETSVRAKEIGEGGGVTCISCPYWFCY